MRTSPAATVARSLLAASLVVGVLTLAGGPAPARPRLGAPGTYAEATRMDAAIWTARQDAYLAQATAGGLDRTRPESLLAVAERGRRDPGFDGDISSATAADFADILGPGFNDDFTMSTLLTLWTQDHDLLSPSLAAAIKAKVLSWKYWWTEEPIRETQGDNYYWTENHQIIFLADEYLAGQAFPDETFTPSGMTGREHMAHAKPRILDWIALRSRYGFSEFLSVPYTAMTFEGVTAVADLAEDPELADQASKVLDMMMVEIASHLEDFTMGGAKGRTYTGNLFDLRGGSTPIVAELTLGHDTPRVGGTAISLAVAHRWRPPEVARRIADSQDTGVVRQHQSMPIDPTAPVSAAPFNPDGLPSTGEDGLLVWWGLGAQLSWQIAPLSVDTIETYNLWHTPNFEIAGANVLENLVKGKTDAQLQALSQSLGVWLNPGLLSEVDTYTWRSPDAMLSTAQDWRAGQRTESALVSQATLHGSTSVFTSLPKGDPSDGGYWSGNGAAPRTAQHDDTAIAIYAPQYAAGGTGGFNGYQPYTHAFFPQDRFDQVVQQGNWTFGRKGDGYVALWSWRTPEWVPFDAAVEHPDDVTSPWELKAAGGPDNVWITRVGTASGFGGADPFQAFMDASAASAPEVSPLAGATSCGVRLPSAMSGCKHGVGDGFTVWLPGAEQPLQFGWSPKAADPLPPLVVDGATVALHDRDHRWESPWATADRNGHYRVEIEGQVLDLTLPVPDYASAPPTTTPPTTPPSTEPPGATPIPGSASYTG